MTNTGITPTTNVVVYDTVPEHTTYKAGSIAGAGADDSANPDLVWNIGQMPVDGVEVCNVHLDCRHGHCPTAPRSATRRRSSPTSRS